MRHRAGNLTPMMQAYGIGVALLINGNHIKVAIWVLAGVFLVDFVGHYFNKLDTT